MRAKTNKRFDIKFLLIPILLLFALPIKLEAAEIRNSYEDYQKTIIYKPTCDPVKGVASEKDCFYKAPKRTYQAKNYDPNCKVAFTECVCYVKTLLGNYSTWGNGGWKLSNNSGPVVGAVIIFDYTHVGLIKVGIDSPEYTGLIGFTDRNQDLKGTIRNLVWISPDDPSIWKYHKF